MENISTERFNGWSSFSHTTTTTIVSASIAYFGYLVLEQVSTRVDSLQLISATNLAMASPTQEFFTLLKVLLFVAIYPAMLWIRFLIQNADDFSERRLNLFGSGDSSLSIFLGLIAGGLIFLCVRFTIQSMMFG